MTAVVSVELGEHAYEVVIGHGVLGETGARLARIAPEARLAVVVDETVRALHWETLRASLDRAGRDAHRLTVAPGESAKSFAGLEALCDELLALQLSRSDLVIAFGGGVIGDLAGFAAAIHKRGIDFIQIPTTLLSQVDSSVGGKTAIDTPRGKNLIGAFHQPRLVLADLDVLSTLPAREIACGYAEILKCALMGGPDFFAWLETDGARVIAREPGALGQAVENAVRMKAKVVAADERERGPRALLNLGHTFGHALEALTGFGAALEHGEAVALGCALAFRFSARLGFCPAGDAERVEVAIRGAGLPSRLDEAAGHRFAANALIARMEDDKKARAGALTFILARGIGDAFVAADVDRGALRSFLIDEGAAP